MRILHVNRYAWRHGGAESYMLECQTEQRMRGDEAEVFGMAHPLNPSHRFEEHFPPYIDLRGESAQPSNKLLGAARIVWSRSANAGLERVVSTFSPDIAHVHGAYHEVSPSVLWVLRQHQIPTVMTVHDYKLLCPRQDLLSQGSICEACQGKKFYNVALKRCKNDSLPQSGALMLESYVHKGLGSHRGISLFLCPSRFMQERVANRIPVNKTRTLPNFVDIPQSPPCDVNEREGVVYAGRLDHPKGVDVLIQAAKAVPNVPVTIVGHGPLESGLRASAEQVPNVRFLGRLDRKEVLNIMRTAVATVLPARWHENQPMSILESFAVAVPVIATKLGGIPEIVLPGVTGALVEREDVPGLAAELQRTRTNAADFQRMGEGSLERVLAMHGREHHMEQLYGAYRFAIAQSS